MLLRKFYINLIFRIAFILSNMLLMAFVIRDLIEKQLMFTFIVLVVVLIAQIVLLLFYIRKTNSLFTKFLLSIANLDFASKFGTDYAETPYKDLNIAFNKILNQYQSISKEKEQQFFLTNHIIQTIPAGILVFNEEGRITFKNKHGENLLGIKEIYSLNQLQTEIPEFFEFLNKVKSLESVVYESTSLTEKKKLSITVKSFELFKQKQKLILIQDISKEIDAGELDAIQRLLRILTHEIMNSLTPINSLTETISMLMNNSEEEKKPFENFTERNYNDVRESVIAIKERGEGLNHFVNNFRTLTKLPEKLKKEKVLVKDIFESICKVMDAEIKDIHVSIDINNVGLEFEADNALIEQVLINLITNSITALHNIKKPEIALKSYAESENIIIQVSDNGKGIPKDKLSDIFIPFYTTKENGSGIGLSFARQIMRLHNGSIQVHSEPERGAVFTLKF